MTLLLNLVQNEALSNFGFLEQGLRVPTDTSRKRIDPREKFSWILEIWKANLESTRCDKQNIEIVSKMKDIKFSANLPRRSNFTKIEAILN